MKRVIIIGGVAGGASTAARLRRNNENVEIIMLERGKYISYANCGLPYYVGNVIKNREDLLVQTARAFAKRFDIDVRTFCEATSIDPYNKEVAVSDLNREQCYSLRYDKLVLSPGARPVVLPVKGKSVNSVFTIRNVPDTDSIKSYIRENNLSKAVIIGAGYIALEMAENLHNLCSQVTVVEMSNRVLPYFDYEMSAMIEQYLQAKKVKVLLNEKVVGIENNEALSQTEVHLQKGQSLPADIVISAAGVKPDTAFLDESGIDLLPNGSILTNEYLQTNKPDIYAVGDAVTCKHKVLGLDMNIYLAGPAAKQGRIAADNIAFHNIRKYKGTTATSIIKLFNLQAGCTGASEQLLKKEEIEYLVSYTHGNSNATYFPGSELTSIKLIFTSNEGKLLGAQVIGFKGVDKRVDILAALIHKNGDIYDLEEYDHAYAPPFSSAKDPLTLAGNVAANILSGRMKTVHWHDIHPRISEDNDVILLDVRTSEEHMANSIPNSTLLPLDELRDKLYMLPRDKTIIVYCRAGQRAYLACRILQQRGFKRVYNLSGGFLTYQTAHHISTPHELSAGENTNQQDIPQDINKNNIRRK